MYLFNLISLELPPQMLSERLIVPRAADFESVKHGAGLLQLVGHLGEHVQVMGLHVRQRRERRVGRPAGLDDALHQHLAGEAD